jgi:amino acid transporter
LQHGAIFLFANVISLTTGIFQNFAFVMTTVGPLGIWTFPVVGIGSIIVAMIFGEISTHVPITGHCYMWVSKLHSKGMGWMIGWINFCFLIIILPSIDNSLAPVVASVLNIPITSTNLMLIAEIALTLQLLLNVFSVKISSLINSAATVTESVGVLLLTILLLFCAFHNGTSVTKLTEVNASVSGNPLFAPILMSFLMGFYTLVGFESAANMSDETHNAVHNVPRAMIIAIGASTIFGTLFLIAAVLATKNLDAVVKSSSPLPLIIESNLGPVVGKLFLIVVIASIFACGLVFMTSASRTVFAMSRDEAFFASGLFKKVSKKTSTPIAACILFWVIGTAFMVTTTPTVLSTACAAMPSLYYLLTIICYALVRKNLKAQPGNFTLGKMGWPLIIIAIAWLTFGFCIMSIPSDFQSATLINVVLISIGVVLYFVYFRKKIAGTEPEQRLNVTVPSSIALSEPND